MKKTRDLREIQRRGFLETYLGIPTSTRCERKAWFPGPGRPATARRAGTATAGAVAGVEVSRGQGSFPVRGR